MTDKSNKNPNVNDMDAFFAEFDKIAQQETSQSAPQTGRTPETPSRSAQSSASAGRASAGAGSTTPSRSAAARQGSRSADASGSPSAGSRSSRSNRSASAAAAGKQPAKKRKKKKKGSKKKKVLWIILLVILAAILAVVIYVGVLIATADTHDIDANNLYTRLYQRSTIYDDEGKEIESVFSEDGNRTNVAYDQMPENMINAIVSIEDRTFWEHHGFNFVRMVGAIRDSIFGGGQISGTSTLTQQLARNVYLADRKSQRTLSRKVLEAYYTVLIEKNLTKKQIAEAYLNTVYLGFNCYGVEAASQAYFNKSVKELDLQQCVALASLPQSPDSYALVKSYPIGTVDVEKKNVLAKTNELVYAYNGDLSQNRRELTLDNMVEQNYITQAEADKAKNGNLKKKMKVTADKGSGFSSYFTDFVIDQITDDIMEEYGWSESDARNRIYTGGLKIYTTMNRDAQKIAEKEFSESYNFPSVVNLHKDLDGNILNNETHKILLYDYDDYFNDQEEFTLKKGEFKENSDGGITIYAGKRLNIYNTTVNNTADVSVEFKNMYQQKDGRFYIIRGGAISIPQGYKTVDSKGNCIVSPQFFTDYPKFFTKKDGKLVLKPANYSLKQKTVQPQGAMVIFDYKTGGIKAMIGGREATGKMLQNRATDPRQPGSSIKPLAVYSSALQYSFNAEAEGKSLGLSTSDGSRWGKYITAGSVINDAPMVTNGRSWPKNWYTGYRGRMTLRKAVEQSVNVCAVKVYQQMGPEFPASQLKKMGITSVVEDGNVNDLNPAALALGGMTHGIQPLQMAAAYGIFPNEGLYTEPIAYTRITTSDDEVLFNKVPDTEEVLDKGVAYIMTSILRSVVTNGLGKTASFSGQPVAGKTGTTTDNYDAWFVGFTPQYTAALWLGNDVGIELSEGSASAARLWRTIMSQVCAGMPYGHYPEQPENVSRINGEYYTDGTYSRVPRPASSTKSTKDETTKKPSTKKSTTKPTTKKPTTKKPTTTKPTTTKPATENPTPAPTEQQTDAPAN